MQRHVPVEGGNGEYPGKGDNGEQKSTLKSCE
jgi:hypothetical protein